MPNDCKNIMSRPNASRETKQHGSIKGESESAKFSNQELDLPTTGN
jgi:hypothetical protein